MYCEVFGKSSLKNVFSNSDWEVGPRRTNYWGQNITNTTYFSPLFNQFSKHRPSGPMLSISRNVHMFICLFVCVFTFEVPFKRLFTPTSWNLMSNIFRYSESLGKSNGKKWSQIWTFLFGSGLKSPRKKHGGNHASRWIRDLWSKGISLILAYL